MSPSKKLTCKWPLQPEYKVKYSGILLAAYIGLQSVERRGAKEGLRQVGERFFLL
jgi:hypothetical protein